MHALDTASFAARALSGGAASGWIWLLATDLGSAVVRSIAPKLRARAVFGAALGYALIGTSVGALALFHALDVRVILGLLLLATLVRIKPYWQGLRTLKTRVSESLERLAEASLLTKAAIGATAFAFIIAFVAAAYPAVWWDPIAYHLPIAALALSHHTLGFDSGMTQTGFPLLAESAALPAYTLAGSAGAAMVTLGAGIVLALLCGALAETFAGGAGALATALLATSALWMWLAPSFYIDVPFALFAVAALAAPILARESGQFSIGLMSGLFAGAAAATKYPGLFVAILALAIVMWFALRPAEQTRPPEDDRRVWTVGQPRLSRGDSGAPALFQLIGFAVGFLLIAAGWYARSYVLTRDPVFPFLSALLGRIGSEHARAGQQAIVQMIHGTGLHFCGGGISLGDLIQLPWRMLVDPRMFCGDPGYALRLGFVLFVAGAFLLPQVRPLVALTVALSGFWFFTAQQWRFLIDALALFAVVVAATAGLIRTQLRPLVSWLLIALCVVGAVSQVLPGMLADASNSLVPGYSYLTGRKSGRDYLRRRLETYAASEWLAQHDKEARVFALDDVRDYYFGPNVAWGNSPYPGGLRLDWNAASADRYRRLVTAGYRYMVVNDNPAYTHRTQTDVDWKAIEHDEQTGVLRKVFSENDVTIYRITPL